MFFIFIDVNSENTSRLNAQMWKKKWFCGIDVKWFSNSSGVWAKNDIMIYQSKIFLITYKPQLN